MTETDRQGMTFVEWIHTLDGSDDSKTNYRAMVIRDIQYLSKPSEWLDFHKEILMPIDLQEDSADILTREWDPKLVTALRGLIEEWRKREFRSYGGF